MKRMSTSESMIMDWIWAQDRQVTLMEIAGQFAAEKKWATTTIATFLRRMKDKGYLVSVRKGRTYLYSPSVSSRDFGLLTAKNVVDIN